MGIYFSIILLETAMIFPCCPFLNSIALPKKLEIFLKNMAVEKTLLLNHRELQEAFFSPFKPQLKNAQVFLSHSHADINKALEVKDYLEEDLDAECVFIDSLFWDYKNNILKEIKKHHIDVSKIEDAFTLILRESLQDMIEKCPYFVFLQSNNSVSNQGLSRITYSAWIYEELKIANSLIADSTLQELGIKAMRVSHNITNLLRRFKSISLDSLSILL